MLLIVALAAVGKLSAMDHERSIRISQATRQQANNVYIPVRITGWKWLFSTEKKQYTIVWPIRFTWYTVSRSAGLLPYGQGGGTAGKNENVSCN